MDRKPLVNRHEQWLRLRRGRRLNIIWGLFAGYTTVATLLDGSWWYAALAWLTCVFNFSVVTLMGDRMADPYYRDES